MNRTILLLCFFTTSSFFLITNVTALESEAIIGGDIAAKNQFPYQISLQIRDEAGCGGCIIGDKYVLTAAHCVIDDDLNFRDEPFVVVAGTNNLNEPDNNKVSAYVDKIFVPANYDPKLGRDIAVLELRSELGLMKNGTNLKKIHLPPKKMKKYMGKQAVVSGYGTTKIQISYNSKSKKQREHKKLTNGKLKYAVVDLISNDECKITNSKTRKRITPSKICGKVRQRQTNGQYEGICSGDSGGPLVFDNTVIGVVSFSPFGCNETSKASIYTRVSSFIPFIEAIMHGNPNNNTAIFETPIFDSEEKKNINTTENVDKANSNTDEDDDEEKTRAIKNYDETVISDDETIKNNDVIIKEFGEVEDGKINIF